MRRRATIRVCSKSQPTFGAIKVLILSTLVIAMGTFGGLDRAGAAKPSKRVTRVIKSTYSLPSIGVAGLGGTITKQYQSRPDERYVSFVIEDMTGLPAAGAMMVKGGPRGLTWRTFCGKTARPLEIPGDLDGKPGSSIDLFVHNGPPFQQSGDGDCVGVATQGTITATFYELR